MDIYNIKEFTTVLQLQFYPAISEGVVVVPSALYQI